jgi:tyrosine-protein kinase Etk/Wzc
VLGVILGIGAAFLRSFLRAGVHDPDLIEKHTNIPVYATIPHSKNQDRLYTRLKSKERSKAILATECPDDPAVESLRNLRTALHFGMMDAKNNCVMIAGPSPTVGKSFVSDNLAAVLASNEQKVLLVDGDLLRGHLHENLGLTRDMGLSDYISGTTEIDDCVQATSVSGLMFMPTGKIPPNPAELLLHQRFMNVVSTLGPQYDHIIIDSPPILAVTDATIIGQVAGATILVLRDGDHTLREVDQSAKRLKQAGVNLRGTLLNDVKYIGRQYGAYGYAYQYAYTGSK